MNARSRLECFLGKAGLTHVREPPKPHVVRPVRPPGQEGTVSVEYSVGLDALPAKPPRRLGDVVEFQRASRLDGIAQQREQAFFELRSGAGVHGQSLSLHEHLEIGVELLRGEGTPQGAELACEFVEHIGPFAEAGPVQTLGRGLEFRQLLGRDSDERAQGVGSELPVAPPVVPVHHL